MHAGVEGQETPFVSNRPALFSSEAIRNCGSGALAVAGITMDDVEFVDIYSCFPSAVQIAAEALGLSVGRQLTVTGGLTFFGGPWNNYVTHSIGTMVDLLRQEPESYGLCTANGGALTKHAVGIYSCRPAQTDVDPILAGLESSTPGRRLSKCTEGEIEVEAFTVVWENDGPERLIVAGLLASGDRAWGTSMDASLIEATLSGLLPHRLLLSSSILRT